MMNPILFKRSHALARLCLVLAGAATCGAVSAESRPEVILKEVFSFDDAQVANLRKFTEDVQIRYSNLPIAKRQKFEKSLNEGHQWIVRGNKIKGYHMILEAESIFADNPVVQSDIGIVSLDLRLFKDAEKAFRRVLKLDPLSVSARYNLAESLFVQKRFAEALEEFEAINRLAVAMKASRKVLAVNVKRQLCLIGLINTNKGKTKEAYQAKYDALFKEISVRKYDVSYYYIIAIDHFRKNDEKAAAEWQQFAKYVFPKKGDHVAYVDALVEFGYVDSYYGGTEE